MNGRAEIESGIRQIFTDHQTAAYVWKIRDVRLLSPEVAVLRAVAGMVPPGQSDLNPTVNTIQTLVARSMMANGTLRSFRILPLSFTEDRNWYSN